MNPSSSSAAHNLRVVPGAAEDPVAPAPVDPLVESYRRLADVFHDVLSEQSLDALLERVARTVSDLIPYDDITFYEADEVSKTLRAVYASGTDAEEILADEPFGYGVGITGWAVENREAVLANRAELDPRVRFVADTPPDPESLIVVPLISRGLLKGTLNIYRTGFQEFTAEEFQLVVRFGDAAALAIDNAHIRATLEHQAQTDALTGLHNHRAFHERLRAELLRASAHHDTVVLVMLDLDDFKRVNDVYGHAVGDQVLVDAAEALRATVRNADLVCRVGGEEFAVIAPSADLESAERLASRISDRLRATDMGPAGRMSISVGIAAGPQHAANPRELIACAEAAMMTAKAQGKDRVVVFDDTEMERPEGNDPTREGVRSIAQLKLLQSVSGKLARMSAVDAIGETIADELRQLIDYHNCRVFVRDGEDLLPIAFRGELTHTEGSELAVLTTRVGRGVTGRVAQTGEPLLIPDAANYEFGHKIEGTAEIEESLLAVPLAHAGRVVGVIVVSKLGLDQFDTDDLRLLQVLAGHTSSALVNAQLYEIQRREAESAKALLELSRQLAAGMELDQVLDRVAEGAARILGSSYASVWLPLPDGGIECRSAWSTDPARSARSMTWTLSASAVAPSAEHEQPFVVDPSDYTTLIDRPVNPDALGPYAVAPMRFDAGIGVLVISVDDESIGAERSLDTLGGIASQAKLAIANAQSFTTLENTFLATVEALANALEAKDEYTSSHARWISDMAIRVGAELGLDSRALKRLELGALFHDIGKIGIPAEILSKPGPLTDEERAIIEQHPEVGERILAPIEQLEDVRPIVRACHERFDGRGYPDRLAGERIPLEARIIFACDAFHAMTTDRPYRSALPGEEALRRLAEASGTQFDPAVVAVCLRVLEAPTEA